VRALRTTAAPIQFLQAEADQLQAELTTLVGAMAPWLLEVPGVGPLSAAQVLSAGRMPDACAPRPPCRPGRHQPDPGLLRAGDPLPAQPRRDRQLNRALHTSLLVRLRIDPDTRAYLARRTAEGKSRRDAKRCLRRVIARQLFRLLERYDQPGVEILRAA
jgi:hypothetical protein